MIRFVHIGDIHLGLKFNFGLDRKKAMDRRNELWSSFERVVKYTRDKNIEFLLIAGDLFENRFFTLGDMKRLAAILNSLEYTNVVIVAGNHDFLDRDSLYNKVSWSKNITIFNEKGINKKVFNELNTVVYGHSWDQIEIKENNLFHEFKDEYEDFKKILIIHGDINRESKYLPLDLKILESLDMDYIALGHIHKPERIRENIAYCGSLEPLDFGELGEHGFFEGQVSKDGIKLDFVPFSKRQFKEMKLNLNPDMTYLDIKKEFTNIEKESRKRDFFRIKLKGYIDHDLNINNLNHDLKDEFYHLEIKDDTLPDYDLEWMEEEYRYTILGKFISSMKDMGLEDKRVKDALYYGLDALLKERVEL